MGGAKHPITSIKEQTAKEEECKPENILSDKWWQEMGGAKQVHAMDHKDL